MKMISKKLVTVGRLVDTEDFNASIFNNLGLDYSDIVAIMAIQSGGPMSFAELSS